MSEHSEVFARHAHFLEQFKNGQVKSFTPFLKRVVKSLRMELLKTNTVNSKKRINAKLKFVEQLINSEFSQFTDDFSGQLSLLAESEAEFAVDTLAEVESITATLPSPNQLTAAVKARPFNNKILKDYLNDFTKEQAKIIRNSISIGFFEGKPTAEIIRDLTGTKALGFKDGLLNTTRASAERMVRTAINHTASVAKELTYEQNDIPFYEWVSVLDGRTSPICMSRDGKVWRVGKGPLPPAHFNCRSTTSPMFEDEVIKVKVTDADPSGFTKEDKSEENYEDFLNKQTKKFQVGALGVTKAELFRKGDLSLDKFVNDAGMTLTLDQLKTTHPMAWGKI